MAGQLIPLPEHDPGSGRDLTMGERVEAWFETMAFGRKMFEAGVRMREGPDADLRAAWRKQYEEWLVEHDEMLRRMFSKPASGDSDGR